MFRSFFGPSLQWRDRLPPSCEGMPAEDVTELSDEGLETKEPVQPKAKAKGKGKAKAKAKSSATPKEAASKTKPVKKKGKTDKNSHGNGEDEEKAEIPGESPHEDETKKEKPGKKVLKKPASVAKSVAKKPAAKAKPRDGDVPKVYKYKYHKDGKWGLKVDGREQFTVRALCQFVTVIALSRCIGIAFRDHVVPCHAKIKPAEHLTDSDLEMMADATLVVVFCPL